jgi:hypothetical protein
VPENVNADGGESIKVTVRVKNNGSSTVDHVHVDGSC